MDSIIGTILLFGFNFAPRGWAKCDGQLISVASNTALFSLLGTQYGGDGVNTFALPDLRGRAPIGAGNGPGLSMHAIGQIGGAETVTMNQTNMPSHRHTMMASGSPANDENPSGNVPANSGLGTPVYSNAGTNTVMNDGMIGASGDNQPMNNMQPYLAMNYCIAINGIYPSRD